MPAYNPRSIDTNQNDRLLNGRNYQTSGGNWISRMDACLHAPNTLMDGRYPSNQEVGEAVRLLFVESN